jgi:hypothetical protein
MRKKLFTFSKLSIVPLNETAEYFQQFVLVTNIREIDNNEPNVFFTKLKVYAQRWVP